MSYSNTFQDYLRDIPMEIGKKFYPPPAINLPLLSIPEPVKSLYVFAVEKKARQQYDNANSKQTNSEPISYVNGITSTDSQTLSSTSIVNELLLPCAAPHVTPDRPAHSVKPVSFEEFEGRGSVFDEVEWRAIDDKLALSQVLGNVCAKSTAKPSGIIKSSDVDENGVSKSLNSHHNDSKTVAVPSIPPYPVLEFGTSTKSVNPSFLSNSHDKFDSSHCVKPRNPELCVGSASSTTSSDSPLRVRLITKGYRENLVNVALEKLPRERLPYVEYYIKGMSILEKRKVDAAKSVVFLLDSNITDKQAVVQRAQTAEQLVGMGFSAEKVFPALLACEGNRVKALDTLLGSR